MNEIDENIKFTSKFGGDSLNFLDMTVTIKNNTLRYEVYRKPTYSNIMIPFSSQQPDKIKRSAFYSMFNRDSTK